MTIKIEKPEILYKYNSWGDGSWIDDFFSGKSLKFTSRKLFNDPYDSRPGTQLDVTTASSARELERWIFDQSPAQKLETKNRIRRQNKSPRITDSALDIILDDVGILALSPKWDNPLLWAHYTLNHTGFCVGFRAHEDVFAVANPVQYQETYPVIVRPHDDHDSLITKAFFIKSECWKYEEEWRAIKTRASPEELHQYSLAAGALPYKSSVKASLDQRGPGVYPFDTASIESITIGMLTPVDRRIILSKWAKTLQVPLYRVTRPNLTYSLNRKLIRKESDLLNDNLR